MDSEEVELGISVFFNVYWDDSEFESGWRWFSCRLEDGCISSSLLRRRFFEFGAQYDGLGLLFWLLLILFSLLLLSPSLRRGKLAPASSSSFRTCWNNVDSFWRFSNSSVMLINQHSMSSKISSAVRAGRSCGGPYKGKVTTHPLDADVDSLHTPTRSKTKHFRLDWAVGSTNWQSGNGCVSSDAKSIKSSSSRFISRFF